MPLSKRIARLRLIRTAMRVWWEGRKDGDDWRSVEHDVPVTVLWSGTNYEMSWYLKGPSTVEVANIEELCSWLRECEYVSDLELFQETDFWQHPSTFELLKKGDCEDYALWTWRKLLELGFEAEFMIGRTVRTAGQGYHAWVIYRDDRKDYLIDPVFTGTEKMILPLVLAKAEYFPVYSVDGSLTRRMYRGLFAWLEDRKTERTALRRSRLPR